MYARRCVTHKVCLAHHVVHGLLHRASWLIISIKLLPVAIVLMAHDWLNGRGLFTTATAFTETASDFRRKT